MANQPNEQTKTSEVSLDDIAATLLATTSEEEGNSEESSTDAEVADTLEVGENAGGDDAEEASEEVPSEGDSEDSEDEEGLAAAEEDEESKESDEEVEYLDLEDDLEIEVIVDGQPETRTLKQLRDLASGEGAIDKRLEEASNLQRESHAYATSMLEYLANQQALYENALTDLDDAVFAELIPKPTDDLLDKNPSGYKKHQKAYEQDQERITKARSAIEGKVKELSEARNGRLQQYAQASMARVKEFIPELFDSDPTVANKKFNALKQTAMNYGYTEQEIGAAYDYRMYNLIAAANELEQLKSKSKEETRDITNLAQQKVKRVRRLKGGSTTNKTRVKAAAKQREAVTARAKETGKVQDIAATLLQPQ